MAHSNTYYGLKRHPPACRYDDLRCMISPYSCLQVAFPNFPIRTYPLVANRFPGRGQLTVPLLCHALGRVHSLGCQSSPLPYIFFLLPWADGGQLDSRIDRVSESVEAFFKDSKILARAEQVAFYCAASCSLESMLSAVATCSTLPLGSTLRTR
jgi:hypothetical protein